MQILALALPFVQAPKKTGTNVTQPYTDTDTATATATDADADTATDTGTNTNNATYGPTAGPYL